MMQEYKPKQRHVLLFLYVVMTVMHFVPLWIAGMVLGWLFGLGSVNSPRPLVALLLISGGITWWLAVKFRFSGATAKS